MRSLLLVDDDAAVRRALRRLVEREGWLVVDVDPARAREQLAVRPFDVVLCDWWFGRETAEVLMGAICAQHRGAKVIVMSGAIEDDRLQACCDRLGVEVIAKPIGLSELRELLRSAIPASRREPLLST